MTPKEKDILGLSFSTIPRPRSAMTTIDAVNATGILVAKIDGETHVSVCPTNATVKEWIKAGPDSSWTTALLEIVTIYGGE